MSSVYLLIMLAVSIAYFIINSGVKQRYCEEIKPLNSKGYSFKGFSFWFVAYDELKIPSSGCILRFSVPTHCYDI